jgi:ABC-type transporter Mla MlaB component
MLRITRVDRDGYASTLIVEGSVTRVNFGLLEAEVNALLRSESRCRIECSGVSYLDSRGAALLRSFPARRVRIDGLPAFMRDFVGRED